LCFVSSQSYVCHAYRSDTMLKTVILMLALTARVSAFAAHCKPIPGGFSG
jgi:hypothetical protein